MYGNEQACGRAIRDFVARTSIPRSSILYTTKLARNQGIIATRAAIDRSLAASGLDYIDVYLLHSPMGGPAARRESWQAVLEAKKDGKIRSVGVSNFGTRHLKELKASGMELPVLNQASFRG